VKDRSDIFPFKFESENKLIEFSVEGVKRELGKSKIN
jgi:hypothetical protein